MAVELSGIFGAALRANRQARGLTQAELAERVGLAVEAYGRLERGLVLPRARTLVALARALGVTADSLLGLSPAGALKHARKDELLRVAESRPDAVELRRLIRRLLHARQETVRIVGLIVNALER